MATKGGKVKCGFCRANRVLADLGLSRTPTRGEQKQYDEMPAGLAKGRFLYKITHGSDQRQSDVSWLGDDGVLIYEFVCPGCHVTYRPVDLPYRIGEAATRGEPVILTDSDVLRGE